MSKNHQRSNKEKKKPKQEKSKETATVSPFTKPINTKAGVKKV